MGREQEKCRLRTICSLTVLVHAQSSNGTMVVPPHVFTHIQPSAPPQTPQHTPQTPQQKQEAIAAEAWRAALSRAAGEKVLDDPKLLRKSIKREQADKARSARKWQERVAAQQEQQCSRQDK